jgi:SAM-dependent methyltransferase
MAFAAKILSTSASMTRAFDLYLTQDVFEHLFDPAAAFREIARTLRTGGAHVFTTPLVRKNEPTRFCASLAPNSIWLPHVLFGPFLLLIAFGAGVATADVKLLPIVIFAGGMLLHGHVAQPLFVIPLCCLALSSVVQGGEYKNAHLAISALILAVFALPIIVDALRGSDSNIATIFHHIKTHAGDHHTVSQGIGYFLSFFLYECTQNIVQAAQPHSPRIFGLTQLYGWSAR